MSHLLYIISMCMPSLFPTYLRRFVITSASLRYVNYYYIYFTYFDLPKYSCILLNYSSSAPLEFCLAFRLWALAPCTMNLTAKSSLEYSLTMSTSVTTTTALWDVPKLSVNGDNFIIFFIRFTWAMKSKGVQTHLDGSAVTPQPPATAISASGAPGTVPSPRLCSHSRYFTHWPCHGKIRRGPGQMEQGQSPHPWSPHSTHSQFDCHLYIDSRKCCSHVGWYCLWVYREGNYDSNGSMNQIP